MASNRHEELQPLLDKDKVTKVTKDQNGDAGGNGASRLGFYSRVIYTVRKKQLIAEGKLDLPTKEERAEYSDEQKEQYKKSRNIAKAKVENDIRKTPSVKYTKQVYRKKTALKAKIDAAGGITAFFFEYTAQFIDFTITFFRSPWQVLSNVWANYQADLQTAKPGDVVGNNDAENPNSHFNQTMYNHNGDPASGPSMFNIGGVATIFGSLVFSVVWGAYKIAHENTLRCLEYFHEKKNKVKKSQDAEAFDAKQVEAALEARFKQAMKDKTLSVYLTFGRQVVDELEVKPSRRTFIDDYIIDPVTKLSERNDAIGGIFRIVTSTISTVWGVLSNNAYVFWLVWMPFVMLCGIAAVATALSPMMPFALLATLVIGTALTALSAKRAHDLKQAPTPPVSSDEVGEFNRLAHETKALMFIDAERLGIEKKLGLSVSQQLKDKQPADYDAANIPREIKKRVRGSLRDRLLGSVHERRLQVAVTGLRGFISGLLMVIFIGWFGSSLVGYLGATGVSDFIGGVPFSGIGGAIAGIINSFISMAQVRKSQLAYERVVEVVLNENSRGNTKEQEFEDLYAQVEYRKHLVRQAAGNDKNIIKYLDKIDPFDPDYFTKFRNTAKLPWYKQIFTFTYFKKGLIRAFQFVFGGQTGALVSRFLLLKGGLLAGGLGFTVFSAGAVFWPLIIASIVMIAVVGALALADYQMKANQGHRQDMLNTLDARIYYLQQKKEELCALQDKLGLDSNATPIEAVVDAHEVAPQSSNKRALAESDYNVLNTSESMLNESHSDESSDTPLLKADKQVVHPSEPLQQVAATRGPDTFFVSGNKAGLQSAPSRSQDTFFAKKPAQAHARIALPQAEVEVLGRVAP